MSERILDTIKKQLGLGTDYTPFDDELIVGINSAIMALDQIGTNRYPGFQILGNTELWSDLLVDDDKYAAAKTYIYLKVKTVFDPPATSFALEAMQKQLAEYEWRLSIQADPYPAVYPANPAV